MRKEVEQLALMGAMPDEADERITAALVDEYADLLGKIVKPVTLDEAHILIKLFPPTALYGIEWTLLHLIESVYSEIKSLHNRKKLLTKQDNAYSVPRLAIISDPKQTNVWKSMI